jgi:putative transposase
LSARRRWWVEVPAGGGQLGGGRRPALPLHPPDPSQWKSARTTNAIECLNEAFRRRIKTQTVLPCAGTVPMLLRALPASGQIQMRKVDGWETLSRPIEPMPLDLAA